MSTRVLRRFVILMALLTVGGFIFWDFLDDFVNRPPGDYETEVGSIRLEDGDYEEALAHFNEALEKAPDHRGALMGRALVFLQREENEKAIRELTYLIGTLEDTLEPGDQTGRGALAAAYANRGIIHDRMGEYEEALDDYIQSLKVDEEAVEGPDFVHKLLYGSAHVSTVRERARYIHEQLQLPEEERVMRIPELDARQRMYKP